MRKFRFVTAVALLTPVLAMAGSIYGTVKYEGKVPKLRPIAMDADPNCAEKHDGKVANEMLLLGEGQTMGNILVAVTNPPEKDYPTPAEPVVMDQNGCLYVPHILGIQVDQTFKILNSDGIMHNVHALPKVNKDFNMAMPGHRKEAEESFGKVEGAFKIKCDVHPWMQAWIGVFKHPYFTVTGADGAFQIADLPDGEYDVTAWHEKLGTQKGKVKVEGGGAKLDFTFSAPKRK